MKYNFRNIIRNYLLDILALWSKPYPGIHILNGHFLSRNDVATPDLYTDLLTRLQAKGVEFIDFELAVKLIMQQQLPFDRCMVAFTFDDGFEECYTKIRHVLNNFNLKAGFFVNPGFINGNDAYREKFKKEIVFTDKQPMTWDQVNSLKEEGHIIGSHTMDHAMLNIQNKDILEYQLNESKRLIEKKVGMACDFFAFPYGRLQYISSTAIEVAEKYFKFIFSQDNYRNYYSFGKKIINRRHFECDWPYKHVIYFLKEKKL